LLRWLDVARYLLDPRGDLDMVVTFVTFAGDFNHSCQNDYTVLFQL
jgi:hypothetical protein